MKWWFFWIFSLALTGSAWAQQTIELDDGRILERARITGQNAATVTIVHAGGITQVEKELLPDKLKALYPVDSNAVEAEARAQRAALEARLAPPRPPVVPPPNPPPPAPAPQPAPEPAVVAAKSEPPALPVTIAGAYTWHDSMGNVRPVVTAHGFIVERTKFLAWAAIRRERYAITGRRLLIDFINTVGDDLRRAAQMRLEHFVALSLADPPAEGLPVAVDQAGQFSTSVPGGKRYVLVMTATRQEGPDVRAMTWFDRADGTAAQPVVRDASDASVGDWNFGE